MKLLLNPLYAKRLKSVSALLTHINLHFSQAICSLLLLFCIYILQVSSHKILALLPTSQLRLASTGLLLLGYCRNIPFAMQFLEFRCYTILAAQDLTYDYHVVRSSPSIIYSFRLCLDGSGLSHLANADLQCPCSDLVYTGALLY